MARGRMLNRTVARDAGVREISDRFGAWAVVFHHRIVAFIDCNGNIPADSHWLKASVMPMVSEISAGKCRKFVDGMTQIITSDGVPMAVRYERDGMQYLHFPQFVKNQVGLRIDKEKPEVPDIEDPKWIEYRNQCREGLFRKKSGKVPEKFPNNRTEKKRKEEENSGISSVQLTGYDSSGGYTRD